VSPPPPGLQLLLLDDNAIRYVLSGFVDDITFAHKGQAQATRQGVYAQSDSLWAAPGTKSDVYDGFA